LQGPHFELLECTPMKRLALIVCCLIPLLACSVRTIAVRTTGGLIAAGLPAFYDENDPQMAREAMPGQLKLLEALLESDPTNADLLGALTEGYTGYAYLFLEDSAPARAKNLYRRAASYGLRLLARNARLRGLEAMNAEDMSQALAGANLGDVNGLYWTAYAWAGWANLDKNNPEALAVVPKAARLMERSRVLRPGYQFGGADLWLGTYYANRPRIAGGDPEKARSYYEAALKASGRKFLTAQLLYAQYYAVNVLDEELFKSLLAEIAAADATLQGARLANEVAKQKSVHLLGKFDDLF
jgi:hypothetical protein